MITETNTTTTNNSTSGYQSYTPPTTTDNDQRSEAREAMEETKERVKQHGAEIADKAREAAKCRADEAVDSTSAKFRNAEKAAHDAIASLAETQPEYVVKGVEYVANRVGDAASYFERKDSKEIADDVRTVVREHPGIVLGGLVAAGFCLGRFLKASSEEQS